LDGEPHVNYRLFIAGAAEADHLGCHGGREIVIHFPPEVRVLAGARKLINTAAGVVVRKPV
jgi:hypothetical protein